MAIVGSAEVIIRAIGDKLEGDIQKSLQGAGKRAGREGDGAGKEYGSNFSDSSKKEIDKGGVMDTERVGRDLEREGDSLGSRLATRLRASTTKDGESIGQDLGNKIGRGVEKSRFQSTLTRSALKLGILIPAVGAIGGALSSLVSGLFAITSAAGTASSALVVIPGLISAAGQAAGTLLIGFKGLGKTIKEGFDPKKATQFQAALKGLSPEARSFVKEIVGLKGELHQIQAAAQKGLFAGPNGLESSLKRIEPLLPAIARGFKSSGAAVADGIHSMANAFTGSVFKSQFSNVFNNNNKVIRNFGSSLGSVGKIIIAVLSAASPLILSTSKAIDGFLIKLSAKTQLASGSGQLTNYFKKGQSAAKLFGDIIGNVFKGLYDIGKIAQPTGIKLLKAFDDSTKKLANFTDSLKNVNNTKSYFSGVSKNVIAIGGLVNALGKAFLQLGSSPGIAKTAEAFKKIIPDIEKALQTSVSSIGPKLAELIGEIAKLFTALENSGAITAAISIFVGFAKAVTSIANSPLGPVIGKILALAAAFKALSLIGNLGGAAFGPLNRGLGSLAVASRAAATSQGGLISSSRTFASSLQTSNAAAKKATPTLTGLGGSAITAGRGFGSMRTNIVAGGLAFAALGVAATGAGKKIGLAHTATLALTGAAIGSAIPGIGTAVGAAAGAVTGFTLDIIGHLNKVKAQAAATALAVKEIGAGGSVAQKSALLSQLETQLKALQKGVKTPIGGTLNKSAGDIKYKVIIDQASVNKTKAQIKVIKDSLNSNSTLDITVQLAQAKADLASFLKDAKTRGDALSLNPKFEIARQLLPQLNQLAQLAKASGIKSNLQAASDQIAGIARQSGLSGVAASALAQALTGVSSAVKGIPPGKTVKIDADTRKLLNGLGVGNDIIDALLAKVNKPAKLNLSVTGQQSVDQALQSLKDLPPDAKVVVKTDAGNVETTVGNIQTVLKNLAQGGVINLTAPNASNLQGVLGNLATTLGGVFNQDYTATVDAKQAPGFNGVVVGSGRNLRALTQAQYKALVDAGIDPNFRSTISTVTGSLGKVKASKANATVGAVKGDISPFAVIGAAAEKVKTTKATVKVGAETVGNPLGLFASIGKIIAPLASKTNTVKVSTSVDSAPITALQAKVNALKGGTVTIKTSGDTSGVQKIKTAVAGLKAKPVSIKTSGDPSGVNKIKSAINSLKAKPVPIKTTGDTSGVSKVKTAVAGIRPKPVKVTTSADLTGVNRAKSGIAGVKGKTVYINVVTVKSTVNKAAGGLVTGPGTPTSDSIPAMLSNGEFVVKASATKKYLSILQSINSGAGVPKALPGNLPSTALVTQLSGSSTSSTSVGGGPQYLVGELTLTPESKVLLRAVSQETVDGNVAYNNSLKRAGH